MKTLIIQLWAMVSARKIETLRFSTICDTSGNMFETSNEVLKLDRKELTNAV